MNFINPKKVYCFLKIILLCVQKRDTQIPKVASKSIFSNHQHPIDVTFLNYKDRKRILITGGAGFVGSHLTDRLMLAGMYHYYLLLLTFYSPLTPDGHQVKRPPLSLQITSNFLVFYGLLWTFLKRRVWRFFRAGPNGPSPPTRFWQQFLLQIPTLLYRGL